jgi:hypothetical protein
MPPGGTARSLIARHRPGPAGALGAAVHGGGPDGAGRAPPPQLAVRPGGQQGRVDVGVASRSSSPTRRGWATVRASSGARSTGPLGSHPGPDHRRRRAEPDAELLDPATGAGQAHHLGSQRCRIAPLPHRSSPPRPHRPLVTRRPLPTPTRPKLTHGSPRRATLLWMLLWVVAGLVAHAPTRRAKRWCPDWGEQLAPKPERFFPRARRGRPWSGSDIPQRGGVGPLRSLCSGAGTARYRSS